MQSTLAPRARPALRPVLLVRNGLLLAGNGLLLAVAAAASLAWADGASFPPSTLPGVGQAGAAEVESTALGSSLASLLQYAREHNPELASMRHEVSAARERVTSAGAWPDPIGRIELQDITNAGMPEKSPSLLPNQVGATKYTLMQPIPFFGKRALRTEAAEADVDQASAKVDAAWAEISAKLRTAYVQYYLTERTAAVTTEIIGLMQQLQQIAQSRYANGLAPQQDAIRAQGEVVTMMSDLLMQENERHHAQARINALLGRSTGGPLAVPRALPPLPAASDVDAARLAERVRDRNPNVLAEAARIRTAEKNRELTYRNRYPDLTVGVSPIQTGNKIGMWEVMLEVNIPLQQGTRRAQEREAEAMLASAQSKRDAVAIQSVNELIENVNTFEIARRQAQLATDHLVPQAQVTFASSLAAYENGKADFATIIDAQRLIRRARIDALKYEVDAQMRVIDIERLLGESL